ncbi:MAG: hypothetical protein PHR91_03820 [Candidatus Omnitrophica bacterium]|nr:hypothetical protein [Candidatus Omnitrophota bacterium]
MSISKNSVRARLSLAAFLMLGILLSGSPLYAHGGPDNRDRREDVMFRGKKYSHHEDRFYRLGFFSFIFWQRPVVVKEYVTPSVVYVPVQQVPAAPQGCLSNRETVTLNVPASNGGSIAVTLLRYSNGFVGPQNEFYAALPTGEQLVSRYGR